MLKKRIYVHLYSVASKRIKYLGVNLMKEVKDLYDKNYKRLLEANREYINKQKHIPCS